MAYIEKGRAKTITKIILWAVVLSFVAAIFVQWGAQQSGISFGGASAFSVNGTSIDSNELTLNINFYRYLRNTLVTRENLMEMQIWNGAAAQIGGQLAGAIFQSLDSESPAAQRTMSTIVLMIGDIVLARQARIAGFRVTDDEVLRLLGSIYVDGKGNYLGERVVRNDLARYSIGTDTEGRFMELLKRHLLARHYATSLFATVEPELDAEVRQVYEAQNRNVTLSYATFDPTSYRTEIEVGDDQLRSYLQEHTDEFVLADMLVFDSQLYQETIEVSDAEIQQYYDQHVATDFTEPETRDVRRILVTLPEDATDEQIAAAEEKISRIYADLDRPGEEFGTVARKYSEDESAATETGTIEGLSREGARDPAFIDAVFALENEGDYTSEAVRTQDGLEIIQLVATHAGGPQPLEEVRDEIRDTIAEDRAEREAPAQVDELRRRAATDDWQTLAEPLYVTLHSGVTAIEGEEDVFNTGDTLNSLGAPEDIDSLFTTPPGSLTNVIGMGNDLVFFKVVAAGEGIGDSFETIKPAVRRRYLTVESRKLAKENAQQFAEAAGETSDLETFTALAGEKGIELTATTTNKYQGTFTLGTELLNAAFARGAGSVVGPVSQGDVRYVALVTEVDELDESAFAEQREAIRNQLMSSWMQGQPNIFAFMNIVDANFSELLDAQMSYLVGTSELKVNRDVLRAMFGSSDSQTS
jgi:parvulin-like peptidyl-prolyl isomerase